MASQKRQSWEIRAGVPSEIKKYKWRKENKKQKHFSLIYLNRSQLAMKFLDPAFTSLNTALNEDLQGKSSKWRFNRTAYLDQRWADLSLWLLIMSDIILTKP